LQSSRPGGVNENLKEGARNTSSAGNQRLRSGLVVSEVALAVLLLIGSGLAINSFARLVRVNAGFSPDHVLTFTADLPDSYDPQPDPLRIGASPRVQEFLQSYIAGIERIPGVKAAGCISSLPLHGENWGKLFVPLDRPVPPSIDKLDHIQYRSALGDYFAALHIPLIKGRLLNDHDRKDSPLCCGCESNISEEVLAAAGSDRQNSSAEPAGKSFAPRAGAARLSSAKIHRGGCCGRRSLRQHERGSAATGVCVRATA
jgi:hypothetical protein